MVISRWPRKEFHIDEVTRTQVYAEGDHIVLKALTAKRYDKLQGLTEMKAAGNCWLGLGVEQNVIV